MNINDKTNIFRVWDQKNKRYIKNVCITDQKKLVFYFRKFGFIFYKEAIRQDIYCCESSIGLFDTNKKMIFDGDVGIIHFSDGISAIKKVAWDQEKARYVFKPFPYIESPKNPDWNICYDIHLGNAQKFKVIGTIHDSIFEFRGIETFVLSMQKFMEGYQRFIDTL